MKVWHISYSDLEGGAARAAFRIHSAMNSSSELTGLDSRMIVIKKLSNQQDVIEIKKGLVTLRRKIASLMTKVESFFFKTSNYNLHSFNRVSSGLGRWLQHQYELGNFDVLLIHWIGFNTISIKEIGKLSMPKVWVLHDQWSFLGAEHYQLSEYEIKKLGAAEDSRFMYSYSPKLRPVFESGIDVNRNTWIRKTKFWGNRDQIICPSNWIKESAQLSTLMKDWNKQVIPYPIDLDFWKPGNKFDSRKILGIEKEKFIIFFPVAGGLNNERKGGTLLVSAIESLLNMDESIANKLQLVVTGNLAGETELSPYVKGVGFVNDDLTMRHLYTASDIVVVPSLQDNLPGTALEATACGRVTLAFKIGGLVDIIDTGKTGFLVDDFNPKKLAELIHCLFDNSNLRIAMEIAARKKAKIHFEPSIIVSRYRDLLNEIIKE